MGEEGAVSGLFWQQRMPVQRGYLHPYTNLRSTPDLCPDLAGGKRKTRTEGLGRTIRALGGWGWGGHRT